MAERQPIVRQAGEGEAAGAALLRITGDETDNRLTILGPVQLEPGHRGPAAHSHDFEETFIVFRGDVTFFTDNGEAAVGEGGIVHVPAGATHTFANKNDRPAELMTVTSPSGIENFFRGRARRESESGPISDEENARLIEERGGRVRGDRPNA